MSAQMLDVSLLGVGTVLRLERDSWSIVKRLTQATNAPPPYFLLLIRYCLPQYIRIAQQFN